MRVIILFLTLLASVNAYSQSDLTFSQAYQKFNQAYQANNLSERIKYGKIAYELGIEKYGEKAKTSYVLALNWAVSLVEENNRKSARKRVELFQYVIEGYKTIYGQDSEKLIEPYIYYKQAIVAARPKEKRQYLQSVISGLEVINKKVEQGSLTQAYIAQVIADTYGKIGDAQTAGEWYQSSYDIYKEQLPENDYRLGIAAFNMGKSSLRQRSFYEAKQYFEQALLGFISEDGRNHKYELSTRAFLVSTLEKMGDSDEATEHVVALGKITPWKPNQRHQPLYRVQPRYPRKALDKGIDGWVALSFTISPTGNVEDIDVVESSNRLFEKPSKDALAKWRYAPKFVDGKAVKSEKLNVRLDFKRHN
ncbi:TonB family protein [Neiella sp. HB171785]|uniref:Protein TonB n=1 Tax=Neiella litorisoli TaxID=2771431 RepID=A0A8J6R269_9GAMM|nr:TonB family protein [Neiella litorisoli]MBD1388645.1 TonB family protein [Neiella litorisoli]